MHLGCVHKAGGMVGPESYVAPLRQLDGLNMESGRGSEGARPAIEKSDQFPLRQACKKAMTEVRSVTIPHEGEAAAVPDGPRR
eukprot:250122-Pyramimonas_sp.AAC.1